MSLATDAQGAKIAGSDARYFPYGAMRPGLEGATLPTNRRYTGQRWEDGIGLYDYNARYYDPTLGRFISADTIVPNPGDPQSLNRYSYVRNNPLKYTDPSGHFENDAIKDFLKRNYGDNWEDVWNNWTGNEIWISMLREAQAGDHVAMYSPKDGSLVFMGFYGDGKTFLESAKHSGNTLDLDRVFGYVQEGRVALAGIFRFQNGHYAAVWKGNQRVFIGAHTTTKAEDYFAQGLIDVTVGLLPLGFPGKFADILTGALPFATNPLIDYLQEKGGGQEGDDAVWVYLNVDQGNQVVQHRYQWWVRDGQTISVSHTEYKLAKNCYRTH